MTDTITTTTTFKVSDYRYLLKDREKTFYLCFIDSTRQDKKYPLSPLTPSPNCFDPFLIKSCLGNGSTRYPLNHSADSSLDASYSNSRSISGNNRRYNNSGRQQSGRNMMPESPNMVRSPSYTKSQPQQQQQQRRRRLNSADRQRKLNTSKSMPQQPSNTRVNNNKTRVDNKKSHRSG